MKSRLILINFLEGACLMALELIASKMISPFFGASVTVWSVVLGTTVGALALGYFYGDRLAPLNKNLVRIFLLSAGYILFLIFTSKAILGFLQQNLNINFALIISALYILLIPMICFGLTTPLIININTRSDRRIGQNSGLFYGVSTSGGIVFTIIFGFYLIPLLGVFKSGLIVVTFLIICMLLSFYNFKKSSFGVLSLCLIILLGSCKERIKNDVLITGICKLSTNKTDRVYLNVFDGANFLPIDNAVVKDDEFLLDVKLPFDQGIYSLSLEGKPENIIIYLSKGDKIDIQTYQTDFLNYSVSGNVESEFLKKSNLQIFKDLNEVKLSGNLLMNERMSNMVSFNEDVQGSELEKRYDMSYEKLKLSIKEYFGKTDNTSINLRRIPFSRIYNPVLVQ